MEPILKDVFAVEVPIDSDPDEWKIFEVDGKAYLNGMTNNGTMYAGLEPLPGSYEILFTTLSCTEDQAAGILAKEDAGYLDYELFRGHLQNYCDTAAESLQSLLRSKNLDPAKNYLLIRKL